MKHDDKIMVWGCFCAHGVGDLYRVEGILRKEQYLYIVENHFYTSAERLYPDFDCIFQGDNDPKHTARIVRQWYDDQDLIRMDWPAQSPDLNPIEDLWAILDHRMKHRSSNDLNELFQLLLKTWNELPVSLLSDLVDSMPRRCQAVIDAKGYATKY